MTIADLHEVQVTAIIAVIFCDIVFLFLRTILLRIGSFSRPTVLAAISAIFVLIAAGRIVLSYSHTAQAFDEPCHVAAGMEFLDEGSGPR